MPMTIPPEAVPELPFSLRAAYGHLSEDEHEKKVRQYAQDYLAAYLASRKPVSGELPREAVEVALRVRPFDAETLTVAEYLAGFDEEDREQLMRAALLAALPVLLGEPRAFEAGIEIFRRRDAAERHISSWRLTETKIVPLYAPSLGEGDGR